MKKFINSFKIYSCFVHKTAINIIYEELRSQEIQLTKFRFSLN